MTAFAGQQLTVGLLDTAQLFPVIDIDINVGGIHAVHIVVESLYGMFSRGETFDGQVEPDSGIVQLSVGALIDHGGVAHQLGVVQGDARFPVIGGQDGLGTVLGARQREFELAEGGADSIGTGIDRLTSAHFHLADGPRLIAGFQTLIVGPSTLVEIDFLCRHSPASQQQEAAHQGE